MSLVLLTAVVVLGMATTSRREGQLWPRFLSARMHRNVSLLALVFLAIHIVTAILDPFAHLGWRDAVIPFASSYRTYWLGLGVVAAELVVALAITSSIRSRLTYKIWRTLHWVAYACWPVALLHGVGTGSDVRAGWFTALTATCVGGFRDPRQLAPGSRLAARRRVSSRGGDGIGAGDRDAHPVDGQWTACGRLGARRGHSDRPDPVCANTVSDPVVEAARPSVADAGADR